MKYIFVSGGVVSGLGKGVTTASLAFLLQSRGFKVTPVKVDMYFNVDAGTLRPQEHGEVFVTHDGMETDEDLGHYERFIHKNLYKENYITAGQIYQEVIRRERAFEYSGETVDVIPHITDEIIRRINLAGQVNNADIVVVEYGGTVGEYKNGIFFEASRILRLKNPRDVIQVHVTYLPYLANVGELKSKPAQTSVHILNGMGIQPDILVARSEIKIDKKRFDKLALSCNVAQDRVFSAPDLNTIYEVPLLFHKQDHHLASACLKLLKLPTKSHKNLNEWREMTKRALKKWPKRVRIAMVGKYFVTGEYNLVDSYVSVVEALRHASWKLGVTPELSWIDAEEVDPPSPAKRDSEGQRKKHVDKLLSGYDAIVVPQGWGSRGTEGKIAAIKFARERKIPYLGLCFGMQMAVIEFARHVLKLDNANTTEADASTPNPVIHIMPKQKEYLEKQQYGGTIRLGAWPCKLASGSKLKTLYSEYGKNKDAPWNKPNGLKQKAMAGDLIFERHRHRYEFNNKYKDQFVKAGMLICGTSPDGKLVEAIELKDHPFFIGTQFHPEYISRPLTPHPVFLGFIKAALG